MNSNKIAVDIALIPPEPISQLAIDINRTFPDTAKEDYALDINACIPHITLVMGVVCRDQMQNLRAKFSSVVGQFSALNLRATGFIVETHPDGKSFTTLMIEKNSNLQKLHETIFKELKPFLDWKGVNREMFYSPPPVREISVFWVRGFAKNSALENYNPHISLGFAALKQEFAPIQFTASRLALCHLGNYCTCRKIISSIELE